MTHNEFIKAISIAVEKPATDTDAIVRATMWVIANELRTTGEVSLLGLGKLTRHTKPAHAGRNPRTGAAVDVPERKVVRFKASSMLAL